MGRRAQEEGAVSPQEATQTGNQTTAIEQEGLTQDSVETQDTGAQTSDQLPEVPKEDVQAAIAGSMGGTDNYPYVDRTAVPLHERDLPMNSATGDASQAELNPAFTPKAEDGGPVNQDGASIGTEPNTYDVALANAQASGDDSTVQAIEEQIQADKDAQMDVDAVNAAAQERAPEGIDASTGQPEGTPQTAPEVEPSPDGNGETAGAGEAPSVEGDGSQSDAPEA